MTAAADPYTLRRFQPQDAAGIVRLAGIVYGDTYTVPDRGL